MAEYRVYCSETQYMVAYVEADSPEEARQIVADGGIDFDYNDTDNFNIDDVELDEPYTYTPSQPAIIHPTLSPKE